jgi:hypothetical protein
MVVHLRGQPGFFGQPVKCPSLMSADGERFLSEDRLAGAQSGCGDDGMGVIWRGDDYRVNVTGGLVEHAPEILRAAAAFFQPAWCNVQPLLAARFLCPTAPIRRRVSPRGRRRAVPCARSTSQEIAYPTLGYVWIASAKP